MKKLNDEEVKERLVFLLEKAELSPEEMRWLLDYLEKEDGPELCEILYKHFKQDFSSENLSDTNENIALSKIRQRLYKKLFG